MINPAESELSHHGKCLGVVISSLTKTSEDHDDFTDADFFRWVCTSASC